MKFIAIKEWGRYQHYKDRNPPWIKLHRELLTSNTWVTMDDASRVLAIAIMLLAAATGNRIPADPTYLMRVAYLNRKPDWSKLIAAGFIEIIGETDGASAALADASTLQADARPETETETETETEKRREEKNAHFDVFWEAYPHKVGKGKAREAFAKAITKAPAEQIIGACRVYQWPTDSKFIPHPATWLNQERWLDKPVKQITEPTRILPADRATYAPPPDEEQSWPIRAATYAAMIGRGQRVGMQPPSTIERLVKEGYVTQEQAERAGYYLWGKPNDAMRVQPASVMAEARAHLSGQG